MIKIVNDIDFLNLYKESKNFCKKAITLDFFNKL